MEQMANRNILIVDDSIVVLNIVEKALKKHLDTITIYKAASYRETSELLETIYFHAAIVDVTLPDASDGDAVDLTLSMGIPTVVLTGTTDKELKELLLSKNIADLILKNNINNIAYAVFSVRRILKNYLSHVLIVDDSLSMRHLIVKLLKKLHLNVLEASDPIEALKVLEEANVPISMIITDYEMPYMDGLEFTLLLRQKYRKDVLSILALSGVDEKMLPTKFLKHGANDFIHKPFHQDELFVRVNTQLELLEMFTYNQENGSKDFLTGIYNRQTFLQMAQHLFEEAVRNGQSFSLALVEIDNLKMISATDGFFVSDTMIKKLSEILESSLPYPTLLGRLSDQTFCVLELDLECKTFTERLESIRLECEEIRIELDDQIGSFTFSAGVQEGEGGSLMELILQAEKNLEKAQSSGRNKIVSVRIRSEFEGVNETILGSEEEMDGELIDLKEIDL